MHIAVNEGTVATRNDKEMIKSLDKLNKDDILLDELEVYSLIGGILFFVANQLNVLRLARVI